MSRLCFIVILLISMRHGGDIDQARALLGAMVLFVLPSDVRARYRLVDLASQHVAAGSHLFLLLCDVRVAPPQLSPGCQPTHERRPGAETKQVRAQVTGLVGAAPCCALPRGARQTAKLSKFLLSARGQLFLLLQRVLQP